MSQWLKDYPLTVTGELIRILPDGLIFMTGFLALVTSSYPFFVLFLTLLESLGAFYLLQMGASNLDLTFMRPSRNYQSAVCRNGFSSATLSSLSLFGSASQVSAFPSASLYTISVAAAYLFSSMSSQIPELEALGPAYSSRFYISVFSLCMLLFVIGSYRMYNECDGVATVVMSVATGLLLGTLFMNQNFAILGPDSINLTGIPLLKSKTANGESIYVCSSQ